MGVNSGPIKLISGGFDGAWASTKPPEMSFISPLLQEFDRAMVFLTHSVDFTLSFITENINGKKCIGM